MPTDEVSSKETNSKVYFLIKDEYHYCFDYLTLYKKDYFALIGTFIAILAVVGVLINTSDSIYWIPISFFMIIIFSIIVVFLIFIRSFGTERKKFEDTDFTYVLCIELFYKNVRPVLYSLSFLLFINAMCVIIVISGLTNVSNTQDIFLNFYSPGAEYNQLITSLPIDEKLGIEKAVLSVEFMYIFFITFQTILVILFTYCIHKLCSPYPASKHVAKLIRYTILGVKQKKFNNNQILSSLYYSIFEYSENILALLFWIPYLIAVFFIIWSFSFILGIPEFMKDSTIVLRGVLIGIVQLIAFVFLLDYFENSQINNYYHEKLRKINELKNIIEVNQIRGTISNIDFNHLFTRLNFLNMYHVEKLQFLILFSIPTFSLNQTSINEIDVTELKKQFNYVDEKIMVITNEVSLWTQWLTFFIFNIPVFQWFLSLNSNAINDLIIAAGFFLYGALLLRLERMILPPSFEPESNEPKQPDKQQTTRALDTS